jgi:hypothetical protein
MQKHHHQPARVRKTQTTDDDGLLISGVEPAIERIAAYPLSTLRMAALDELKRIPDWVGSRQFVVRSDVNRLASLLTWLRLYQILALDRFRSDPRAVYYRSNAFADVNNPIGKIITQARDHTLAPLLPADFDELLANLDTLSRARNASSEQQP